MPTSTHPRPPSAARARAGSAAFADLLAEVHALGLMRRRHGYYWSALGTGVGALGGWVVGCLLIGDSWWQLGWAAVLALVLTQLAFLGHAAAHRQIFDSGPWNDWVGLVVADLLVGISAGWWRGKHARHHAYPNNEGLDPDVRPGALALTPAAVEARRGRVSRWVAEHQGWLFFPMTLLEGVSLHRDGVRRVLTRGRLRRRWVELAFLGTRLTALPLLLLLVMSPGKAAAALAVQLAVFGLALGSSFAPNHIGMPLVPTASRLDFAGRQVLVSRNVGGGGWVSVAMGGLDRQIEHHLFPSMPRPHLARVQPLVRAFCADQGLPYVETGLWQAYGQVVRHLDSVGSARVDPFLCPLVAQRRSP